ncbi:hypothetical protein OPV22_014791 [Ensete ventricosum]|uniref:Uncharacterized protein n=1 Tax=Ensete ventricosum TaxID=4639 RepID=A0A445MH47_ENSVE|nr:hypothetical protein OPV22_014791 [Ensete ventricosum]RWW62020.1 hypothetical protein BHE74_00030881 [Ensete ventricosum]RZR73533.1 hypothetical protein BHM03_00025377 [Ensete ventricosum]
MISLRFTMASSRSPTVDLPSRLGRHPKTRRGTQQSPTTRSAPKWRISPPPLISSRVPHYHHPRRRHLEHEPVSDDLSEAAAMNVHSATPAANQMYDHRNIHIKMLCSMRTTASPVDATSATTPQHRSRWRPNIRKRMTAIYHAGLAFLSLFNLTFLTAAVVPKMRLISSSPPMPESSQIYFDSLTEA